MNKLSFRHILVLYRLFDSLFPLGALFGWRRFLLRAAGAEIGEGVRVSLGVGIFFNHLSIGRDTWVGPGTKFYSSPEARISIGARCDIAPEVMFVTGSHEVGCHDRRAGKGVSRSISVGDGTWIGVGSTLLGGVELGKGSIVGAGSLVLPGTYPDDVVLVGTPAKIQKNLAQPHIR